ncbi:immunoglobulin-like domain-containing protein [Listeria rustica]|uniref:DUF5011 domain-containing protein n=1 Tax=Listeria rustica TaxID=2713503 RepID=A0A7W1YG60_9LIST|nr:immunoglobulin-like domain-containing protein [Listeria rustica]MBA3926445.1 DUF5011 domain-containing protein [Listeria rustica]
MTIKKVSMATAALVMTMSLPIQTYVNAAENPQGYTMKAETKLKGLQASPSEGSFSDVSDYFSVVSGSNSSIEKNVVTITPDETWQTGGLWSDETNKVDLTKNFHLEADLYLGNDPLCADGMAFVMQNDPRGKSAIGGTAGALGAYGPNYIQNALAVEMDTYCNTDNYDPGLTSDHIAITIPKNGYTKHEALSELKDEVLSDGQYRAVSYDWNAATKTLSYSYGKYSGSYTVANLQDTFGGTEVIFGFTGATGSFKTLQQLVITSLQVNGISPELTMTIQDTKGNKNGKAEPSETVSVKNTISNATTDATAFNMQYGVDMDALFDADTVSNIELKRNDGQTYAVTKEQLLNHTVALSFADPSNTFTLTYDVQVKADAQPKGTALKISGVGQVNGIKYTSDASITLRIPGEVPVITAVDSSLKKGSTFDPMAGVSATDAEDGNMTSKIKVTANDVDTSKVGTYHVTYSVTDSDDNTTTKTVTVTVTSNDVPVITANDKTLKKGSTFNPSAGVTANDTEDGDVTSKINITANDVDTSKVGTYHVTYSVTDSDGNTTTKTITVMVTSNDAPVIAASDKTLKKGGTFSPMTGVSATDTEDGNVTSKISVTANDVDTSKVGTYHVTYSVTDSDGNTTTKTITVTVASNDAPVITASDKTLKKGGTFSPMTGVSATDVEDGNVTSGIKVTANDVDTSKVGTYHVTYSVTDSDGNTTTKTITVTVTSNDAPVITASDKTLKKGGAFSPMAGVSATDTEDGNMTSKISVTANDVDTSKVGTYHVTYSVTDSDGNTTTKTIAVTVTSNDAPVIQASDITMRVNKPFNVKNAVNATDTEDGDITSKISVTANDVNTAKAGVYHVTYSVTDSDGNTTTKTITVTVLTDDAPILTTSDVYLKVGDSFDPKAGVSASDTEDGNITSKIKIESNNVDMSKDGSYAVVYSVTDSDNNTTKVTRHVYVRTNDKPVIHASDITFKAGYTFDVKAGISASDTEDGDITSSVKIVANDVDASTAGTYHVTYSVTDSDNNTITKTIIVTVLTNEKPVIDASDVTRKAHRALDPMANVTASDLEDGDITSSIKIIANDVNIDVPGEYHTTYSVIDSDGNATEKTITVTILSNDAPVITGKDSQFKAGRTFDPMAGISANDTEDGDITSSITLVSNDVNPDVAGVYHVTYSVTDSDGNTTEATYTVTVLTNEKPVIHASDITLAFGQKFDPMAGVTAEDLEDGDITNSVKVISNDVNPNQAGIYHVTYSVIDSDGNETQFTITVIVGAQPITPIVPPTPVVKPVAPAKPVAPVVTPKPTTGPVIAPVVSKVTPVMPVTPSKVLPKTGDESATNTMIFGGLLAAFGALFLRRKK